MVYLLGLIIPLISFLFETYPRFINRYFGVDVWSRMLEADYIRKNHHKIPMGKISDGFIIEGYLNYPPLLPWLLSFIPKKKLLSLQGFISPLFDVILNYVVFFIALQLTDMIQVAFLAQIVYATIPLAILENSYLTPRSLGYLIFTLAFYFLLLYSIVSNPLYLVVGFLFTFLCFFSHRFATQALLFICIFFSFIDRTPFYILVFIGALLSAIVVSKGYYLRVLNGHIQNIYFWMLNYKLRFAHQARGIQKGRKKRDFVSFVYYVLGTFTPVTLIATNLWLIAPLLFFADSIFRFGIIPSQILNEPLYFKMSIWVVFFYTLSVLILSIQHLQPIGEGQRYLEMAFAPTAVLSGVIFFSLFHTTFGMISLIIFLSILFTNIGLTLISQWMGIIHDKYRSIHNDMIKVFAYINKVKPPPRIMCLPHQITTMIIYNTKAKVLVDIESGTLQKMQDVYPVLKMPVKKLAKKYNLNMLILKKFYVSMEELKLDKNSLLFETEETQIFKL